MKHRDDYGKVRNIKLQTRKRTYKLKSKIGTESAGPKNRVESAAPLLEPKVNLHLSLPKSTHLNNETELKCSQHTFILYETFSLDF